MIRSACFALLLASPVAANDGFGGLSATGLHFAQTDAIAMEREDLFIGLDRVAVDYTFRNLTDTDVTGEMIFPLPPIPLQALMNSDWNLPDDDADNLVNFTVTVGGQPVRPRVDRIAVIEPPWQEDRPLSDQYDTPGQDVTEDLARFGIPLTLEIGQLGPLLLALSPQDQAELTSLGLAEFYEGDAANNMPPEAWPLWSIVLRYHWTQTFPAGAALEVSHAYDNRPSGSLFGWTHPPQGEWEQEYQDRYCIDDGTSRAIAKRLNTGGEAGYGTAYNIAYVLRTANSWAGPIGQFRLTLDKGAVENVISLCVTEIQKTGPTTFVVERTDYTPDRDLEILIVAPPG